MENGVGGFTPEGREYVVVLDGERETPQPWSNVLANPGFGTIVTRRRVGLHLGRQQPREPADAVCQRPADRSDQRGAVPSRRGHRRRVGRDTGPAAPATARRALGDPPRRRRHAVSARRCRHDPGTGGVRRRGRSGQAGAADGDEHLRVAAPDQCIRLRRMVPRAAAQRRAAVRGHRHGSRYRRHRREEHLQQRAPGGRRVLPRERVSRVVHRRSERVRRPQPQPRRAGRALSRGAGRAHRGRPGPLRGAASGGGSRTRRDPAHRLRAWSGTRPRARARA